MQIILVCRGCFPVNWLRITGLAYGGGELDLIVRRHGEDIAVNIERRSGETALIAII